MPIVLPRGLLIYRMGGEWGKEEKEEEEGIGNNNE
jgi:hypothetical protein